MNIKNIEIKYCILININIKYYVIRHGIKYNTCNSIYLDTIFFSIYFNNIHLIFIIIFISYYIIYLIYRI